MEYLGFIFGVFGLMAYLQVSSLKRRLDLVEKQLTGVEGTTYAEDRTSLMKMIRECTGKSVTIDLKEDNEDPDIMMYGNTAQGTNAVLDVDDRWMLVRIESKKGTKEKLIRLDSVQTIGVKQE
ncbi:MAG: hypothetical protein E7188_00610 [Erysipelotrichaceae bacterium]|nr:hypothetical protein [Erysipelotrichaceae bacterium]